MPEGVARKAVKSSIYSLIASMITLVLGAIRSILLARWLLPQYFGVMALALIFLRLVNQLRSVGLQYGLIHRQDADPAFLRTFLSLYLGIGLAAASMLLAAVPLLQGLYPQFPQLAGVLRLLILAFLISNFNAVQETLMRKNLEFKSLAVTDIVASLVTTIVAPALAWYGWGIWALVAEQISGVSTRCLLAWGPFRQWRASFGWDRDAARWFWNYGKSTWMESNLAYYLDRFDDFWVGTVLGDAALGFYSKAFEFSHYPTRLIAAQLISVFTPVFARLQHDRVALSRSFFRSAYVILRTGALAAGFLFLIIPEFIHYVIGDKWLPMLWAFRLMLGYAIFNPVIVLIKGLLLTTGRPREALKTSAIQAVIFTPAVILGARLAAINGVALAADGMLVIGILMAYRPLRRLVDFSSYRLAGPPLIALTISLSASLWVGVILPNPAWLSVLVKSALYLFLYAGLTLAMERKEAMRGIQMLWSLARPEVETG